MKNPPRPLVISVIGASDASPEAEALAEAVGRGLAERGAVLVCGGLGGVMAAACRGAKSADGTTIGILPGSDPGGANPWVDIPIPTGLGYARDTIVVNPGAAVIAVCGAYGPERLLFGTAFPTTGMGGAMLTLLHCDMPDEHKEAVAGRNLQRLLDEVDLT